VRGQGCDVDGHVREEREVPEQVVQLGVAGDVEDAEVGVLPGDAPDVGPLAGALQFLAVGLLFREELRAGAGVHVGGQVYFHVDGEQHASLRWSQAGSRTKS
jgi:hypothetical protein